ncbi:MAG: OmpA family protein [Chitinophagales bacterium]|nr:OmpA family protein [Chitinophagales bacterium]
MKYLLFFAIVFTTLFTSCVTKKEYQELEEVKNYYETEAQSADSIRNEYNKLAEEGRQLEIEIRNTRLELEEYVVTNRSLHRSYQAVLDKMELIRMERDELDETTAYEKYNLQQQLSQQQYNLDESRDRVTGMERELYQKDNQLNAMEYDYTSMKGSIQEKNLRIAELEQMLSLKENNMDNVRERLNSMLLNFSRSDLNVEEKGGKLYVSLSSNLLFPSGSTQVNSKGKGALRQLAETLKSNPDIDILVEGHTDSDGNALANWKLSVNRAVAVTDVLTSYGINPERIIAAGRGEYVPKAANNTPAGKALNRRTEIVLSPKLDELYEFLSRD